MRIELILLGVIAVVLILDFIIRGIKKKDNIEKGIEKFEGTFNESKKQSKFNYILSRRRNIVSFIILVHILKISIHYFFYTGFYMSKANYYNKYRPDIISYNFSWHCEKIYSDVGEVWLFIPSFIIFGVIVWLFKNKIKAR